MAVSNDYDINNNYNPNINKTNFDDDIKINFNDDIKDGKNYGKTQIDNTN